MIPTRTVVLLAVAVVGLSIAPVAAGAVAGTFVETETGTQAELGVDADVVAATGTDVDSAANTTVATFMQSSAADAQRSVEAGMFDAEYERADDEERADLIANRTDDLADRLERLEAERAELRDRSNGNLSTGEYQARMGELTAEIAALEREIEHTKPRAEAVGVGSDRLETLERNASSLAGPDVAATAQGLGLGASGDVPGGGPTGSSGGPNEAPGQADDGLPPGQTDGTSGENGGDGSGQPGDAPGQGDDGNDGSGQPGDVPGQ